MKEVLVIDHGLDEMFRDKVWKRKGRDGELLCIGAYPRGS